MSRNVYLMCVEEVFWRVFAHLQRICSLSRVLENVYDLKKKKKTF